MANPQAETITVTTDASGDSTDYSAVYNGKINAIQYDGGMAAGADLTITTETTGQAVLTITNAGTSAITWSPQQPAHGLTGTALGGLGVSPILLCNERLKIVTAQGGDTDTGVFILFTE